MEGVLMPTVSNAQHHNLMVSKIAAAAYLRMMKDAQAGLWPTLHVYYKPMQLAVMEAEESSGWTLAFPEAIPGNLTHEQVGAWLATRCGRVPYLNGDQ